MLLLKKEGMEAVCNTIAAISTPPGIGAIGIIRISGSEAYKVFSKIFFQKKRIKPRYIYHGYIADRQNRIDDVCCVYFKNPNSYTGEDLIEIHSHSNPLILKMILSLILDNGARLAYKGEFTKRAFLNGKMDLTKAESVIELIRAKSNKSHAVALSHLYGSLFSYLSEVRNIFIEMLAQIEAVIDFPDDVEPVNRKQMLITVDQVAKKTKHILKIQDFGKLATSGVKCLIVGRPNVGKSSLLNKLAGEERALVTKIAGTTRDFIDVQVELGGVIFEFIDTAGLRESPDYIEHLGVKKVSGLLQKADLILWVLDNSTNFSDDDLMIYKKINKNKNLYLILNKSDKKTRLNLIELSWARKLPQVLISAKKAHGLDTLKQKLYEDIVNKIDDLDLSLICNVRQISCLKNVVKDLKDLKKEIENNTTEDLLSINIKNIIIQLGELTGEEVSEEVLNGIFSQFCIGK